MRGWGGRLEEVVSVFSAECAWGKPAARTATTWPGGLALAGGGEAQLWPLDFARREHLAIENGASNPQPWRFLDRHGQRAVRSGAATSDTLAGTSVSLGGHELVRPVRLALC